ncbi:hypothetical protein [Actinoplanes sp. NPDC026670]|uniref:hypothetical protein n=1 Tax=Actinoplanes sp. NPDC026670 TaxID=3154700 RepID=UPI0033E09392
MDEQSPWKGTGPGRLIGVSIAFGALLALSFVAFAVYGLVTEDRLGALISLVVAVYFGHLAAIGDANFWRPRRVRRPSAVVAENGGLTFRFSSWARVLAATNLLLTAAVLILFGVGIVGDGDTVSVVAAIVAFAAAAWLLLSSLRLWLGGRGRLRVSPDGLEHRSLGLVHRLPWHSIVDVIPATIGNAPAVVVLPSAAAPVDVVFAWFTRIGGRRGFRLPSMILRGMWLAGETETVYQTLRHYHANPTHRTELATEAARQRIDQQRLILR